MKIVLSAVIVCLSLLSHSQNIIDKAVGDYQEVKVYDRIVVNLIQSSEQKVVIKGEKTNNVEVINKNGKLKIRMKIDQIFNGHKTVVQVYYTYLKIADANEGSTIIFNELLEQDQITLKAQEGGIIKAGLNCKIANIRAVTGGNIQTSGQAEQLNITVNTGGIFEGERCQSKNSNVFIQAAGEAHVMTKNILDVKIRAGGDVFVYGEPQHINENIKFGGRIYKENDRVLIKG